MHLPRAGQPSRRVPVSPHLRLHFIIRMRRKWVERKKLSLLVRGRKTEQPQRVTSSSSSSSFLSIFSLGIEKFYRNCCSLTHKPQRHQLNIWELIGVNNRLRLHSVSKYSYLLKGITDEKKALASLPNICSFFFSLFLEKYTRLQDGDIRHAPLLPEFFTRCFALGKTV